MKITIEFDKDGDNLQKIIEENLLDFYYTYYELKDI